MFRSLFRNRQTGDVTALLARVRDCEAEQQRVVGALRALELEQATMHEEVRKWMRRAVAAERRAGTAPAAEAATDAVQPPPTLRARIERRRRKALVRASGPQLFNGAADAAHAEE